MARLLGRISEYFEGLLSALIARRVRDRWNQRFRALHGTRSVGDVVQSQGWRQGSVFRDEDGELVAPFVRAQCPSFDLASDARMVVISQTCDLVAGDSADEPHAEVLVATLKQGVADNSLVGLKSSRRLHVRMGNAAHLDVQVVNRILVPRSLLAHCSPDPEFSLDEVRTGALAAWLVQRYRRTAFPDAFERRLRQNERAIDEALKASKDITHYRLAIKPGLDVELPDNHDYMVTIAAVHPTGLSRERIEQALKALNAFEMSFSACAGITVEDSMLFAENEFTIEHAKLYFHWNRDYVSYVANDKARRKGSGNANVAPPPAPHRVRSPNEGI